MTDSAHHLPVAVRPQDMLEDKADERVIDGVSVRKGTLGAFILNAKNAENYVDDSPERKQLLAALRELAPAVQAVGLLDVFEPRAAWLRELVDAAVA